MLAHGLNALIAMVLLFFLFALLVSAVMEAVSSALKLRGNAMKVALEILVDDARAEGAGGFGIIDWAALRWPGIRDDPAKAKKRALPAANADKPLSGASIFKAIFEGSLVGGLRPDSLPTYIEPRQFAITLLEQFRTDKAKDALKDISSSIATMPPGRLKNTLTALANDAGDDYEMLKKNIAGWFDEAMSRLSGEYKRFTQLFTFLIAFGLAVGFNINAVHVGERLLTDRLLAEAIAEVAIKEVEKQNALAAATPAPAADPETASATETAAETANVPAPAEPAPADPLAEYKQKVTGAYEARTALFKAYPFLGYTEKQSNPFAALCQSSGLSLLGWLLMAFSAVVGAPFWFDLLQRFINIRGAGPKPGTTTPGDGK